MTIAENYQNLFSVAGKIILLTGATGGIGSELSRGLASLGAELALADMVPARLDELIAQLQPGNHRRFILDVSQKSSIDLCVEQVIEAYGQIDVLINCAGINKREGFLDVEEATYDRIMDINLKGVFFLTQAVVRQSMIKTGGKIINIGSHNCTGMLGGVSVYGASKSGLAALTRSMAIEWGKYNILANCIAPGHILTDLTKVTWANEQRAEYLRERITLERPGNPGELVGLTVLLASDAASYMTGQLYHIDGGALAGGKPWPFDTKY